MSQGENQEREVRFDLYCKTCMHKDESVEWNGTCDQCLSEPVRYDSEKPVKYEQDKLYRSDFKTKKEKRK